MFNIMLMLVLIFLAILNILIFKDVISPPVILSAVWVIPVFVIVLSEGINGYQLNEYAFVFIIGIIFFMIGFLLANKKVSKNNNSLKLNEILIPKKMLKIFLGIEIIVFLIFLLDVYIYVMDNFKYNFWFSYKWATELGYFQELSIMPLFRAIARFLVCALFINLLNDSTKENKVLFIIQLIITSCYCGLGQGRGGIFAFIIPLFIIYLIMRRKSLKQIFKMVIIMAICLVSIFIIYSKLKSPYQEQNSNFFITKFQNYVSGSLVAFCRWAEERPNDYTLGRCTFRFFFAVLNSIGFDVGVESLVEPYVENLNGNVGNVYTIYKWYANDFGIIYAIFIQFLIGILHGILYKNTYQKRTFFWLVLNAIFFYPLMMQFFMDEYSTLFSLWLQYIIMGYIFLKTNIFFERKYICNNGEEE